MIYIFLWKCFLKQIYSYGFHFFKINNLKAIHDLYSQYLIQILSKTIFFSYTEGVLAFVNSVLTEAQLRGIYTEVCILKSKRRR